MLEETFIYYVQIDAFNSSGSVVSVLGSDATGFAFAVVITSRCAENQDSYLHIL